MLQGRFGFTYQVSAEFKARCRLRCGLAASPKTQAVLGDAAAQASANLAFRALANGATRPFKQAFFL